MAITQVDKMKILNYFRRVPFGDIYYRDLVDYLGKKAKITDAEFTEFFADYIIDSLKKDSLSISLLNKMVSILTSFIGWLHNDKKELDLELVNKLHSIRGCYEQFLVNTQSERDEFLDDLISTFESDLKEYYPLVLEEEKEVNVEELIFELDSLRRELSEREKEVAELTLQLDKQTRVCDSKRKNIVKLHDKLESACQDKRRLESKIRDLEAIVEQLNSVVSSLRGEVATLEEKSNILTTLKDKLQTDYYGLKLSIKALRKKVEEKDKEIVRLHDDTEFKILIPKGQTDEEVRNNKIDGLIIQKMLTGKFLLEDIRLYLAANGYFLSLDELRNRFKAVKTKMEYIEPEISENVEGVEVKEGCEYILSISDDTSYLDLMIVSDFHLSTFGKEIISDMELINDYCEENGIHTILNDGDFFSWTKLQGKHEGAVCQRIVDKAITKYPSREGIKHAILGGNHDKDMIAVGVDPIQLLSDAREDFINLGYSHCKITFNGSNSILGSLGMHHPNRRYPETLGNDSFTTEKIKESVNNSYSTLGISNKDVYVDLVGHIHKSILDIENGLCIVPSYRKDRVLNGAWHVRVYFKKKKISNMVFMPVIKTKKLVKVSEISYKKQLTLK